MKPTKRYLRDLGERVFWTAAQGAVAAVSVMQFDLPQWAVTPGQSVVLYDGDRVVGSGTVDRTHKRP